MLSPTPTVHHPRVAALAVVLALAACAAETSDLPDAVAPPPAFVLGKADEVFTHRLVLGERTLAELADGAYTLAYTHEPAAPLLRLEARTVPVEAWRWTGSAWSPEGRLWPEEGPRYLAHEGGSLYLALFPILPGALLDAGLVEGEDAPAPALRGPGGAAASDDGAATAEDPCAFTAADIVSFSGTPGSGEMDALAGLGRSTFGDASIYDAMVAAFRRLHDATGATNGVPYVDGAAMPDPRLDPTTDTPADVFVVAAFRADFEATFRRAIPARCVGFTQRVRLRKLLVGRNIGGVTRVRSYLTDGVVVKPPTGWLVGGWNDAVVGRWYTDTTVAGQLLYSDGNPTSDPTTEVSTNDNPMFYGELNLFVFRADFETYLVRREGAKLVKLAMVPWSVVAGARPRHKGDPTSTPDHFARTEVGAMQRVPEAPAVYEAPPPGFLR